jgi:hypothetical protein
MQWSITRAARVAFDVHDRAQRTLFAEAAPVKSSDVVTIESELYDK